MASPPKRTGAGKTAIASAGNTTRSCVRPTERTARAHARGRSTSRAGSSLGKTQQTDYPRTRPELPNHEPRGCSRGASYSWYMYSANRVKHPLIRTPLLKLWRAARETLSPVAAWALHRRGSGPARVLYAETRARRLRPRGMGRGERNRRGRQRLYDPNARSRPDRRFLAHPRHVDGVVRRRFPVPFASRRRVHVVLRLVLRPAPGVAHDVGRADRRAGVGRLVQLGLPDSLGFPTCRRRGRPTRTSIPKRAIGAPSPW